MIVSVHTMCKLRMRTNSLLSPPMFTILSIFLCLYYFLSLPFFFFYVHTLISSPAAVITRVLFDPSGRYIVSCGGSDRFIRLWHNTPGMREQLRDLKQRLPLTTGESMKVRN